MFRRQFVFVALLIVFVSVPALAKKPYRLKTSAVVGGARPKIAIGPYKGSIGIGGSSGSQGRRATLGRIDTINADVRSPQGAIGEISLSSTDLAEGMAHTVNLRGGSSDQGRTFTLHVLKLKNALTTLEFLLDDRPDSLLDGRRVVVTRCIASRLLKGKFSLGFLKCSVSVGGARRQAKNDEYVGRIDDMTISFASPRFRKDVSWPRSLLVEGAVQTQELRTPKATYSVEIEILAIGPGWITISIEMSDAS